MFQKKYIGLLIILLTGQVFSFAQGVYQAEAVEIDFFSSAPVEDIHAVSKKGISVLNSVTGEISFSIGIKSFQFRKTLMQEHFNEKFMETHKYPRATFKGNIKDLIDMSLSGVHDVLLQGTLEIHGEAQKRQIPAQIKLEKDRVYLYSKFDVACEDHSINIPKILWKNIAEVVEIEVKANYIKFDK